MYQYLTFEHFGSPTGSAGVQSGPCTHIPGVHQQKCQLNTQHTIARQRSKRFCNLFLYIVYMSYVRVETHKNPNHGMLAYGALCIKRPAKEGQVRTTPVGKIENNLYVSRCSPIDVYKGAMYFIPCTNMVIAHRPHQCNVNITIVGGNSTWS
jgi:hypothetical protein